MAKKRGSRGGSSGFEVVPAGANTSNSTTAATAKKPTSQNTLRQAHSNAMKKSEEIWFRKCGHGQRLFAEYYRATGSPIPPSDWPKFESAIKQSLPVTFRFRSAAINTAAQKDLEKRIRALGTVAPVPWAPAELGVWQATTDKRALSLAKREGDDPLAAALADGVSAGLLNRQECVSMLPVLALRVPAGGCVLDVCASPGQKTIQLLEAVSADGDEGRGMVVANDAHPKRVQALIEAIGRHARPASERQRLVVACHRGESFPAPMRPFRKKKQDSDDDAASASSSIGFDRVLADVPCSGDGTVRKDPTVLPRWTPAVGTQLHAAQLEIAWRGLNLLRVGGKMVYSTCSLNPIEDEAVVAALLARAEKLGGKGAVLLDKWPANVLPKLKRRAGLSTWRVADHVEASAGAAATEEEVQLRWHESHEAAVTAGMPHALPTLWPPLPKAATRMRLERCSRLLPHDQDTGGFFIALLRKRRPLGSEGGDGAKAASEAPKKTGSGGKRPATGPASCRELPPLPEEEALAPLPDAEADELGARLGVRAKRRRLLRAKGGGEDRAAVHVAPSGLTAFKPGELCVASAGLRAVEAIAGL